MKITPYNYRHIEALAGASARLSRSTESMEQILADKKDNSGLFRFAVDYGHSSVKNTVSLVLEIRGISQWLAFHVWYYLQRTDGTECSTRYLYMGAKSAYYTVNDNTSALMGLYHQTCADEIRLLGDVEIPSSYNTPEKRQRYLNNLVLDKTRYFLPCSLLTNLSINVTLGDAERLARILNSHHHREFRECGEALSVVLREIAPNLIKHDTACTLWERHLLEDYANVDSMTSRYGYSPTERNPNGLWCQVWNMFEDPLDMSKTERLIVSGLSNHKSRYAPYKKSMDTIMVAYGGSHIPFAEIRDMNRHKPGKRFFYPSQNGFYSPQLGHVNIHEVVACRGDKVEYTDFPLGTTFTWERLVPLSQFLYECELRTAEGAHENYRRMYAYWFKQACDQLPGLAKSLTLRRDNYREEI